MFSVFRRWPFLRRAVVVLFALPLMFAGGSLVSDLATRSVGGVGSLEISYYEFDNLYRAISEQYLSNYNLSELTPEIAEAAAGQARQRLVSEYLVRAAVAERGIDPPDSAVADEIRAAPEFQDETGNFSLELFNDYAYDTRRLESEVRETLQRRALMRAATSAGVDAVRDNLAAYRRQMRVVEETILTVTARFNIGESDISDYYFSNQREYRIPETADWEYILITAAPPESFAPPDEEILSLALAELRETRGLHERRTVRHIFIAGEDEDARARAEELAERARAAPDNFAELAREFSEDAGSAADGGNLGIVARGDLPPEMEAEVFALADGEIGAPVAVDGGFSILLAESSAAEPAPDADSSEEFGAESELLARRILARNDLADRADELQEIAFVNIGSLVSVAAASSATIQTAAAVPRNPQDAAAESANDDLPEFFRDEEILSQLFVPEVLTDNETSPAIVVDDDTYLMARAARYQPPSVQPLAEVGESIAARLAAVQQIAVLQEEAAESESGDIGLPANAEWRGPFTVGFFADETNAEAIDAAARNGIFNAALDGGLPAFAPVPGEGIVRVFRISEVQNNPPSSEDADSIAALLAESEQIVAVNAYLENLRKEYEVYFSDLTPQQRPQ